jgi:hypothetical protein
MATRGCLHFLRAASIKACELVQNDLMTTLQMEVLMPTITVTVTEDHLVRMKTIAESFGVTIEELVHLSIEDLLSRHDEAFTSGTGQMPGEKKELD